MRNYTNGWINMIENESAKRNRVCSEPSPEDSTGSAHCKPPVFFIGGLGGSGTRVFADLVQRAGIDIGNDVNESLDDLTFTLIMKRPRWLTQASQKERVKYLQLFCKIRSGLVLDLNEQEMLKTAYNDMAIHGHNVQGDGKGAWAWARYESAKQQVVSNAARWGWKEPNSVLFADDMLALFPETRFVFVMRNGLDMAFSNNQQQLFNWYSLFDLPDPKQSHQSALPSLMLDYWIAVAEKVYALQQVYSTKRVAMIRFEDLFTTSNNACAALTAFLELDAQAMSQIQLKAPSSIDRYKSKALDCFTPAQFAKLRFFGYDIPA